MNRAELQVSSKDVPDHVRFGLINNQSVRLAGVIAQRQHAPHPHALGLGLGDLVPDALAGDLSLELSEGEQNIEGQPPHRGGGVEGLGDRDERHPGLVEHVHDAGEVGQGSGQAIDLVDHHHVHQARFHVSQELGKGRASHASAGEAAIVVALSHQAPALAGLRPDVGLAGLPLGVQAVEALLQALLGAFPSVDRAAQLTGWAALHGPSCMRSPKNRGPFQRIPVISRATADRLLKRRPW